VLPFPLEAGQSQTAAGGTAAFLLIAWPLGSGRVQRALLRERNETPISRLREIGSQVRAGRINPTCVDPAQEVRSTLLDRVSGVTGLDEMGRGSPPERLSALWIVVAGTLLLVCDSSSSPAASGTTLPRNVIVSLSEVSRLFPDIARQGSTGRNSTATGNPKATRMVIYESGDGSKKVTLSVDQYRSSSDASSAYQQAVQKSQSVPGFKPVPVPAAGRQTFAGTTTMGAETHIGLGALDHTLIVGATLAGYDATPDNIAKLVDVARMQGAAAKRAAGPSGSR